MLVGGSIAQVTSLVIDQKGDRRCVCAAFSLGQRCHSNVFCTLGCKPNLNFIDRAFWNERTRSNSDASSWINALAAVLRSAHSNPKESRGTLWTRLCLSVSNEAMARSTV